MLQKVTYVSVHLANPFDVIVSYYSAISKYGTFQSIAHVVV